MLVGMHQPRARRGRWPQTRTAAQRHPQNRRFPRKPWLGPSARETWKLVYSAFRDRYDGLNPASSQHIEDLAPSICSDSAFVPTAPVGRLGDHHECPWSTTASCSPSASSMTISAYPGPLAGQMGRHDPLNRSWSIHMAWYERHNLVSKAHLHWGSPWPYHAKF